MTRPVSLARWALLGLLLGLMSCGGGIGGTGITDQPGTSAVVVGAVTRVDSLVVDGITFDTTDAAITLNGQRGVLAELQVGQVVTVRGTLAPSRVVGTAATVAFASIAQGPIARIDSTTNRLLVLGHLVRVDDTTQFGTTPFGALVVGNIVELSGFTDAAGVLRATRVAKIQEAFAPGTVLKSTGTITHLDVAQRTFTLQMLRIDFSAAKLLNLPGNQLRNGQMVSVTSGRDIADGVLVAESVTGEAADVQGTPGQTVELQGIVTRVTAADTFEVNGQLVRLTPVTVFTGGTAGNIEVNVRLEVEGLLTADGSIIAEEVDLSAGVERQGIITRILAADTFEVNGQPVRLTPSTVFTGGTRANIALNAPVEVEGLFAADGVLVATEINFRVEIQGRISRIMTADLIEVDGQAVQLTLGTTFEGGTVDDLVVNVSVEVEGFLTANGVLVAAEVKVLQ